VAVFQHRASLRRSMASMTAALNLRQQ